tara:strand:+ start:143 stop:556 length:414 start_codon:yes stop_codon:yes gene_type:complete
MKKNRYDLFLTLKKLKKNKLLSNLSTLNDEKDRLDFVKKTLLEMLDHNEVHNSNELWGSDLRVRGNFRQNLMNKIEVSKNREDYVLGEIQSNLEAIGNIEKQKKKIKEKKRITKIRDENLLDLKKENYFKPKNSVSL